MNEGAVSAELGLTGWPAVAEESIIARDVLLAEHVGSRLHVCHLSTAGSVRHHPLGQEARRQCHRRGHPAPPAADRRARARLRRPLQGQPAAASRRRDVMAVREGLADGTIDIVATDHARTRPRRRPAEWAARRTAWWARERAARRAPRHGRDGTARLVRRLARVIVDDPRAHRPPRRTRHAGGRGQPATFTLYDRVRSARSASRPARAQHELAVPGSGAAGEVRWTVRAGIPTVVDGRSRRSGEFSREQRRRPRRHDRRWPSCCWRARVGVGATNAARCALFRPGGGAAADAVETAVFLGDSTSPRPVTMSRSSVSP